MLEVDIAKAREDFALRLRFRVPRGGVAWSSARPVRARAPSSTA